MFHDETPDEKQELGYIAEANESSNVNESSEISHEVAHEGDSLLPEELDLDSPEKGEVPLGSENPQRNMDFLEVIYGVMVQPRETFAYLGEARPVIQALAFLFFGILISFLVNAGELKSLPTEAALPTDFSVALLPIFLVGLLASLLAWFVNAGTVSLISQLFGGSGNGPGVLSAFSFATLPFLITGILDVGIRLFAPAALLAGLINLAGLIWFVYLNIIALQEIEHLSRGRAILVYFAVPLSIMVSVLVFAAVLIAVFGPLIGSLPMQ